MDHNNKLDTNIYKIIDKEYEGITIREIKYQKYSQSLLEIANKHNVKENVKKYIKKDNCIVFDVHCEYTGIHYHSIKIHTNINGTYIKTNHSSHRDGSLTYPFYESFLISKIKYFEEIPDIVIYINESIPLGPDFFHNDNTCQRW